MFKLFPSLLIVWAGRRASRRPTKISLFCSFFLFRSVLYDIIGVCGLARALAVELGLGHAYTYSLVRVLGFSVHLNKVSGPWVQKSKSLLKLIHVSVVLIVEVK